MFSIQDIKKTISDEVQAFRVDSLKADDFFIMANYKNEFLAPVYNILNDYHDYFQSLLEEVYVDPKYFYQPSEFQDFYYGTPNLDFLVMYFADITTLLDFNKKKIKILPKSKTTELYNIAIKFKERVEDSKKNPKKYIEMDEIKEQQQIYEAEEMKIKRA